MPFLLELATYASVSSLFEEMLPHHLAVPSVLAGILPGRIYVDDPNHPTAAILVPANQSRIYLGGEPAERLLADIINLLFKPTLAQRYWFTLHYPSDTWQPVIEHTLQGLGTSTSLRHFYRLTESSLLVMPPLKDTIILTQIAPPLLEDARLANRDRLIDEIHSESPSLDYFFHQHFGYCARDGQQLIGWCLAEYHYQSRYELGIETIQAYQRQGIATHVASAVINQAFATDATEIGWHCWANNTASIATALKLGFRKALEYPVITCDSRLAHVR